MKIILDLDTGIDDAFAIAYTLGNQNLELLGITSVFGNIDVEQASQNSSYILSLLARENIPVYVGAKNAINTLFYEQKRGGNIFHGKNGFANIDVPQTTSINKKTASEALVQAARTYGKELTIIATGPLTNIANAIKEDAEAMRGIANLVIMGGALCVRGNVSPFAEANINQDAHSANEVFTSGIPITMIGLDVTLCTLLTREDVESWKKIEKSGRIYYELADYYLKAHELISPQLKGCALHDPLAVGVAYDETYVKTLSLCLRVITEGDEVGRVVLDQESMQSSKARNVKVAYDVDADRFKHDFILSVKQAFENAH